LADSQQQENRSLRGTFEYNLTPFPPTLQNQFGSISANAAGSDDACERGEEAHIDNQQ